MSLSDLHTSLELLAKEVSESLAVPGAAFSVPIQSLHMLERTAFVDTKEIPDGSAACPAIVESRQVVVLEDMDESPRFGRNPSVIGSPFIRSYLGAPIFGRNHEVLGTVCAYDSARRKFSNQDISKIQNFAIRASAIIELINLSIGMERIIDKETLLRTKNDFALLGYDEISNYLVSLIYKRKLRVKIYSLKQHNKKRNTQKAAPISVGRKASVALSAWSADRSF
jgi:GAF domain-containing protein